MRALIVQPNRSLIVSQPMVDWEPKPALDSQFDTISKAAYFKSEARGFQPGHEVEDWLAAEREFKLCG